MSSPFANMIKLVNMSLLRFCLSVHCRGTQTNKIPGAIPLKLVHVLENNHCKKIPRICCFCFIRASFFQCQIQRTLQYLIYLKKHWKLWAKIFTTLHYNKMKSKITKKCYGLLKLKLNVDQYIQQTSCKLYPTQ